jgi:hypothetical protein
MELKLLLFLILGTIVFGQIAHYSTIGKLKTLRKKCIKLSASDVAANIIWFCFILVGLIYLVGWLIGGISDEYRTAGRTTLKVIMLAVIVIIFSKYNLYSFIKIRWKIITPIASIIGVVFTMYVNVYVDAEIFRYTQLNASIFPNAQKLIFFCMAPFFALLFSLYGMLVFYFTHAFIVFIRQARNVNYFNNLVRTTFFVMKGIKISKKHGLDERVDLALLIGLLVFILTMPILLSEAVDDKQFNLNKLIEETLVTSSYHVKGNESCTNIEDEKITIMFIKNDKISAVKSYKDGTYDFYVGKCKRKTEFQLPTTQN